LKVIIFVFIAIIFLVSFSISLAYAEWDFDNVSLEILDVTITPLTNADLLQIHYELTNKNDNSILMKGKTILELRSFERAAYESEARVQQLTFDRNYESSSIDNLEIKYKDLQVGANCEKVDFRIQPAESIRSVICFDITREKPYPLKLDGSIGYYLVLSKDRNEDSCPECTVLKVLETSGQNDAEPIQYEDEKTVIRPWVKQVAKFWISDQIDDVGFVQVIEYLVKNDIIMIPYAEAPEGEAVTEIPSWIKRSFF